MDNGRTMSTPSWLSIVMPVLDEAASLGPALQALQRWRAAGAELIVVDGGSRDNSLQIVSQWADLALTAPRGRAAQMNAGAARAQGQWLLFLHADTRLPEAGLDLLARVVSTCRSMILRRCCAWSAS